MTENAIHPNLFIIGAQKAGTTALHTYLSEHPDIFMSDPKEPHFFAEDRPRWRVVQTLPDYLKLFEGAEGCPVVGESSATYLSSAVAVRAIRQFNPDARIIIMLRNPIELVRSFHAHMIFHFEDDVQDFEAAWNLQVLRRQGQHIPATCTEPFFLQYAEIGKLGAQVERVLEIFPREQVKLLLHEQFLDTPRQVYEDVLAFLGLPTDNRQEFPAIYETRVHSRLGSLMRFLIKPPPFLVSLKSKLGLKRTGLVGLGIRLLTRKQTRVELSPAFRKILVDEFRPDVETLSRIVQCDLDHWLA